MESIHDGPPERSRVLALALAAAEKGMAVFPVKGKAPLTKHGYKDASRDRSRVTAMFNATPHATGYGIAMGGASGGLVVVDVDGPEALQEAKRRGLVSGHVVKTGRPDGNGYHVYLQAPEGVTLKSCDLAPDLELKAEGTYVVGPGSWHPDGGHYRLVKGGDPSPTPAWVTDAGTQGVKGRGGASKGAGGNVGAVSVDVAGPPIPDGERNVVLTRIAGRLHDGSRGLEQLTADLQAVNEARCQPPKGEDEVVRIANSIYGRPPCNAAPEPTPWVKAAVEYLRGVERPVKGMGGATGWAIYNGLLDQAARYGWEHEQGVALRVDMRTAAQLAATNASTVSRWLKRTELVSVVRRGSGRRGTTVVLHVPDHEGHQLQHSSSVGDSNSNQPRSVATSALHKTVYRLRWSGGSSKARRGVVKGVGKVRQGVTPSREGVQRIGKSKAAILSAVVDCGGEVSRAELAEKLGRKPASMRTPLRWLVEAGLLVKPRRGYYAAPADIAERLEDARVLGREPEADRLQIAEHNRQRQAYHEPVKAEPVPTEEQMRQRRENYPERRRAAIEGLIARLFAEHPEYRGRRVGQITARLVHYLGTDFPRGDLGAPKDAEVEAILDGVA